MFRYYNITKILTIVFRVAAIFCIILIPILSLLPVEEMPHTGIPKGIDHFIAYWGTGGLVALAFSGRVWVAVVASFGLVVLAGGMEVLQAFTPGRTPMFSDFLMSGMGALSGLGVGMLLVRFLRVVRDKMHQY